MDNPMESLSGLFLISGLLLSVCILLMVVRIAFSKNVPERMVALDTINTLIIVLMIVLGAYHAKGRFISI